MTTTPPPAPDDDPRFAQYIADVGPMQQHPDDLAPINVGGLPVVVAITTLCGLAAVVAALGWAALWLAIGLGVAITGAVIALFTVGTVLVIIGGAVAYAGHHRSK
jgi:hypothetical protein